MISLTLPVLIPLTTGLLSYVTPKTRPWQICLSLAGSLGLLLQSLYLFSQVADGTILSTTFGGWTAPFGIVFVADILSATLVVVTGLMVFVASLYAYFDIDQKRLDYGFISFLHFMTCGICGAFLTGDLFNLYVWFEVMLITSFALLSLGSDKYQLYGCLKYISLNLIATVLFLSAIGMLYGVTGTLNMAHTARRIQAVNDPFIIDMISIFFIVAFGIKSAIFPLFFWLPASYHLPPVTVSAFFAGMMTKVGVYALLRIFTLIFTTHLDFSNSLFVGIAGFTMVSGVLGASVQFNIRRILSFHIISQIGYMIMGMAIFTVNSLSALLFFLFHNIIAKSNLFFISGIIARATGSFSLKKIGGLYRASPGMSILFFIPAFSLAGFPFLSGFWAKFSLIKSGIDTQHWWLVGAALFTGLFTLFSMTKIWSQAFWKPHPVSPPQPHVGWDVLPCTLLAVITLIMGLFPQYLFRITDQAALQLLQPQRYIKAVLSEGTYQDLQR